MINYVNVITAKYILRMLCKFLLVLFEVFYV